jgi:hypothetical protein
MSINHTGFCLGDFELKVCSDCPSFEECLEMRRSELAGEINEIDSILEARNLKRIAHNFVDFLEKSDNEKAAQLFAGMAVFARGENE